MVAAACFAWQPNTVASTGLDAPHATHGPAIFAHPPITPSLSEPDWDTQQQLRALEERLARLEQPPCDSACFDTEPQNARPKVPDGVTLEVHGRIHADLWAFPGDSPGVNGFETGDPDVSPQDRLGFRRLRIDVRGELPAGMLYKLETELAGGNESEFRDIYLGWKDLPWVQRVLIGNQKRPYGLDHLNSSNFNVFLERPFVIEGFNQDARRVGVSSYGVSDSKRWNWQYGLFNQRLIQDEGLYTSDHWQAQVAGRIANTAWWDSESDGANYAHWALAGTWANTDENADDDTPAGSGVNEADFRTRPEARTVRRWLDTDDIDGGDDYTLLGVEGVVNLGPLQLVSEYQNTWLNRPGLEDLHFHGGYVYLSYFLTGEHMPWNRQAGKLGRVKPRRNFSFGNRCGDRGCGAWQIAARYSYADFTDADVRGGIGESLTLGLNWYWSPNAKMQFNYIYGEITDSRLNDSNPAPNSGDYHLIGTRFLVNF